MASTTGSKTGSDVRVAVRAARERDDDNGPVPRIAPRAARERTNMNEYNAAADMVGKPSTGSFDYTDLLKKDPANPDLFDWDRDTEIVIDSLLCQKQHLVSHQLESYREFIEIMIPEIVRQSNPIIVNANYDANLKKFKTEYEFNFRQTYLARPSTHENDGTIKPIIPSDARLRNFTYAGTLYVDIEQKKRKYDDTGALKEETSEIKHKITIGKIPIMLQSKYCILSDISGKSLQEMGECQYDIGGYFIVNGSEKVIIAQERMATNTVLVYNVKNNPKFSHSVEINSSIPNNPYLLPRKTIIRYMNKDSAYGKTFKVSIPLCKQPIPLFVVFRALGVLSDKEILQHMIYDMNDNEIVQCVLPSIEEGNFIHDQDSAIEYISKYIAINTTKFDTEEEKKSNAIKFAKDILANQLLPHVGTDYKEKAYFLGHMIHRVLLVITQRATYDDRDHYANKRIDLAGHKLGELFYNNFQKLVKNMKNQIYREVSGSRDDIEINIAKIVKSSHIESGMQYSLATGNWGKLGMNKTGQLGIAQVLQRITISGTLSHLRRVNTPIEKTSKMVEPHKLHNSQYGVIDPSETPEGHSIGIVKNLSAGAHVTLSVNSKPVVDAMKKLNVIPLASLDQSKLFEYTRVFLNGKCYGVSVNPEKFVETLKTLRRNHIVHMYTSIFWNPYLREIRVLTDSGRACRPLYIVNPGNQLKISQEWSKFAQLIKEKKTPTWKDFVFGIDGSKVSAAKEDGIISSPKDFANTGAIVEYIDCIEAEGTMVANYPTDLTDAIENKAIGDTYLSYTHCEIHPTLMFGVLTGSIPFPEHNQAPRNTFQGAMGKQALGIYVSNFNQRMDTLAHVLHYPQRPFVTTKLSKHYLVNELPSGENLIVAIAPYSGYTQEDSNMLNQSAVDRGMMRSTFYRTYKDEEKKNSSTGEGEIFCNPAKKNTTGLKSTSYENIDDDGFVRVNTRIHGNDVIIGKSVPVKTDEHNQKVYKDASTTCRSNEEGMVDKVIWNRNGDGFRFCKVRIRSERIPEIGDKFSSRFGQKGTCGMKYRQQDMPFTKSGIVPDIIINPHALPSRMTIAQPMECVLAKVCTILGIPQADSTAFSGTQIEDISKFLKEYCHMNEHGDEVMYNGFTGEQFECKIFIGPTYYQRLKHLVRDKIHSRGTGPINVLTRQPAEGRARDGGLRVGEMERDCLLAHGMSSFLKERLLDMSDKFKVHVCKQCGLFAISNTAKNLFFCKNCNNTTEISAVYIPYAYKLLTQELMSMSIVPRIMVE